MSELPVSRKARIRNLRTSRRAIRSFRTVACASLLALGPLFALHAGAAVPRGLPRLAPTALPAPEPKSTTELEQALSQMASAKVDEQKAGAQRLEDGGAHLLPAMARKLSELRKSMNKDLVAILVTDARKGRAKKDDDDGDKPKKKRKPDAPAEKKAEGEGNDWLALVTARPKPFTST